MAAEFKHEAKGLRLSDKVYIIFEKSKSKQLSIDEFCQQFCQRFDKFDFDLSSIKKLAFVHTSPYDNDTLYIFLSLDDICPNGIICSLPPSDCQRIHVVHYRAVCEARIQLPEFQCTDANCDKFHLFGSKITDRLLSEILYLYKNRNIYHANKTLSQYHITMDRFIDNFLKRYKGPPLPNMDARDNEKWREIVDSYNKYYFDRDQQIISDEYARKGLSYLSLWQTENYIRFDKQSWTIKMNFNCDFFDKRTCFDHTVSGKCPFWYKGRSFCPYFHPQLIFLFCSACVHFEKCVLQHRNG